MQKQQAFSHNLDQN